jgi:DNA-binding winged helix-turn-helix (wHTH) protein
MTNDSTPELRLLYSFDDVCIDPACFEVRRSGRSLDVEPKVFDVILCLLENRDRVVTKEELFERVWEGRRVAASVLPRAVCLARKIVGEHRIRTLHRRGYRFVGESTLAFRDGQTDALPPTSIVPPYPSFLLTRSDGTASS